jgi:hypothetical protein
MKQKQEIQENQNRDPDVWSAPWECIRNLVLAIIEDCDKEGDYE